MLIFCFIVGVVLSVVGLFVTATTILKRKRLASLESAYTLINHDYRRYRNIVVTNTLEDN